jgi:hypothetical protein
LCAAFRRPTAPRGRAGRTTPARCDAASPPAASGAPPPAASLAGLALAAGDAPPAQWELDFCSRPLLDERGKKVWELLVTSPCGRLRYCEYFPNNKINSHLPAHGAVCVNALLFAGAHKSALAPGLLLLGLLLGGVYVRTRSLAAPIALHGLWNLHQVAELLLG